MLKFGIVISLATCVIYLSWIPKERGLVEAQAWNISNVYKPIDFDVMLTGSFNLSQCSRDVLNCWQFLPHTGVVCHHGVQFDSACALMRNYCTDMHPLIDAPGYTHVMDNNYQDLYFRDVFDINAEVCPYQWNNYQWT